MLRVYPHPFSFLFHSLWNFVITVKKVRKVHKSKQIEHLKRVNNSIKIYFLRLFLLAFAFLADCFALTLLPLLLGFDERLSSREFLTPSPFF